MIDEAMREKIEPKMTALFDEVRSCYGAERCGFPFIPIVQISTLSLFNREPQLDHIPRLIKRYTVSSSLVRREILLAAAESGEGDWLRERKEDVPGMNQWTKRAYLYASRQLPAEERKFFLRSIPTDPFLGNLVASWAKQ